MMKRLTLCVVTLLASVTIMAQSKEPEKIKLTDEQQTLVMQNNDFAFRLFRQARADESLLLSPLSITLDLGMLNNGADGVTREEIDAMLGSKGAGGADAINQFSRKLLDEGQRLDEKTRVAIANNIYVNSASGNMLLQDFVDAAGEYYDAKPESRDFTDGKTRDVINLWAAERTEGMIEEVIKEGEFNPDAVSYLLNALYFKGEWTHKFNAKETRLAQFDGGQSEDVQMMHQESDFAYAENKTYQSIVLPYGNKAYQMTVFLPNKGRTVADVIGELNGKNWQQERYETCHVDLSLPRFETSTDIYLEDIMKALGMPNAFEGGYGFNKVVDQNVFIGMMKQVAKIKLDEEGTEASAVTVIELDKNAAEPRKVTFRADRPFLYVISERSTGAIFFIGQFMGQPLKNQLHDISLTDEERQLVQSNNDFAFRLMRETRKEDNLILSPLSITYALGMLNNGAAGQTQQEINEVLGFGKAGADAINQFCLKMLTESGTLDEETKVNIANTIFVNSGRGYQLQPKFVEQADKWYNAQPDSRDFADGKTMDVINQWASDHTEGMIKQVLDDETFDPTAISYLLNAIYFKGAWMTKFDPELTREEPFNGGREVPMMHNKSEFLYSESDDYQSIRLPYGNGAYLMTVYLPHKDKTIADVLSQLDGKSFLSGGKSRSCVVDLKLPRFETDTNVDLKPIMSALGMPSAFSPMLAEFPYFCNVDNYIGLMLQVAKIKLDEEGTEAAAVTVIGERTTAVPDYAEFYATRPFLYIISEQSTGAIFFIGQYMGETSRSGVVDGILQHAKKHIPAKLYNLKGQRLAVPPTRGLYISDGQKVVGN